MKKILLPLLLSLSTTTLAQCPVPDNEPRLLSENDGVQQYRITLSNAEQWLSAAEVHYDEHIEQYLQYVLSNTTLDQAALLRKQRDIFAGAFGTDDSFVRRYDAVLEGQAGSFESASCLDQLLLSGQLARVPAEEETEFQAYIFRKEDDLTVYVAWRTEADYSAPPVRLSNRQINRLANQGWQFEQQLHNHPFFFNNRFGDIAGTVIGSTPDWRTCDTLIRNASVEYCRITNGIDSANYFPEDIQFLLSL